MQKNGQDRGASEESTRYGPRISQTFAKDYSRHRRDVPGCYNLLQPARSVAPKCALLDVTWRNSR